ncbi:uncharacterized protein LAESUDRAFT_287044 [Laetiporus sulphureus 93-53]|uniref:Uncharacterized protein n=1 Tax=Laetiporus sulphureus 93-53 TaxID=1314785 RepID=A0A165DCS8_9APHY|nr:uncharacterized protein LAESUDRAFT_287044 [Laetiporus sulphureus 93-53]KZT04579.1 hypothetical protein LAESUDRAFT_287044 [Laetiporus sulphureus 93-53]
MVAATSANINSQRSQSSLGLIPLLRFSSPPRLRVVTFLPWGPSIPCFLCRPSARRRSQSPPVLALAYSFCTSQLHPQSRQDVPQLEDHLHHCLLALVLLGRLCECCASRRTKCAWTCTSPDGDGFCDDAGDDSDSQHVREPSHNNNGMDGCRIEEEHSCARQA